MVPEFVNYWRDRGQSRFSWGNAFYKHVLKEWRNEQTRRGAHELASTMSADWAPSPDAMDILENAGINSSFIQDAVPEFVDEKWARSRVPEFVLYWKDSQQVKSSWNTVFLQFIKQDWARQLKKLESAGIANAENQSITGSGQQRLKEKFQQFADRSWAE